MATMDVFTGDAFSSIELTTALERVPFQPSWLGSLNIFEPRPVRTETVAVERRGNTLALVQTSQRGAPLPQATKDLRDIRDFRTVRVAKGDRINASEIQNIRQFGSESEVPQVQAEVMRRMIKVRRDVELTHENMRLGAVSGVVLDADGSTIRNWFSEFGINAPTESSWALASKDTDIRTKCHQITRQMAKLSEGAFLPTTQVYALAGDNFYDALTNHPDVKQTYLNWQAAAELRGNLAFGQFEFGRIRCGNSRGTDDGAVGVSPNSARFFPVGAPGVFEVAQSPGESFEWVNQLGRDMYAVIVPDRDRNMFVDVEVYSYPLHICTRPQMLLRGKV